MQAGVASSAADVDISAYIKAVETADGQSLENGVKIAIGNFIRGCKTDGIWSAIVSCCVFAGARTLNGALIPLKGPNLTNNQFTSAHYLDRKNGLLGGGLRYLDSNVSNLMKVGNIWEVHAAAFTTGATSAGYILGSNTTADGSIALRPYNGASSLFRVHNSSGTTTTINPIAGFVGASRVDGSFMNIAYNTAGGLSVSSLASTVQSPIAPYSNIYIFDRQNVGLQYGGKISFYSLGYSLNLNLLAARVQTLMTAYSNLL